jgi:CDP-diacylglycerol--glycerol-3-phosphate 3-phosphatidyltransferase
MTVSPPYRPDEPAGPGTSGQPGLEQPDTGDTPSTAADSIADHGGASQSGGVLRRSVAPWLMKLPNQLTWLRIACIPIVVVLLLKGMPVDPQAVFEPQWVDVAAAAMFGLAASTDFFDGWIARKFGAQSILGKLLDPLADKLLVVAAMIILVEKQRLAGWIAVVLIVRDLGINAIRLAALDEKIHLDSSMIGKAKTLLLDLGIAGLMVHGTLWGIPFLLLGQIGVAAAMASSLISAALYLVQYGRELKSRGLI